MSKSLSIENMAMSGCFEQELKLSTLDADLGQAAQYNPEQFHALIYRPDEVSATMNVFRTGSCTITGASSEKECLGVLEHFLDSIDAQLGQPALHVNNLLCSGSLDTTLQLSAVTVGLGFEHTEYEPELFPGLVYRPPSHEATVLLFSSGRVVVTGATVIDYAEDTFKSVKQDLISLNLC